MQSLKPGRGPSAMGAVVGVGIALFGVFWTIMALSASSKMPGPMSVVFPLFGVFFVCVAIAGVVYNLRNATGKNRMSAYDLTTGEEEPDPLNQAVRRGGPSQAMPTGIESRLKEVDQLRARGVISAAEHAAQRERILKSI